MFWTSKLQNHWAAAAVLMLAALLFGIRIDLPLLEPEEARYAEIPRQMSVHGRFLVPIRDGQDYLDKPPLLYWLVMGSLQLFGVHDGSARLPTVITAWLTVAVVLAWGWRTAGPGVGLAGALVLTLMGDFVYRAPMLTMNGPLALFVTASLAAAHIAMLGKCRNSWWLLSGAACGLGILTKGPVAAALILPPLVVWPWIDRALARPTWQMWVTWLFAAGAVAGPWFVAVALQQPEFIEYFFWKHHVERYTRPFDHAGPFWEYVPQLILGFLPWTLIAVLLLIKRKGDSTAHARIAFVAGIWGFIFFSLAGSKRPVYLVAVEPALALAAGSLFWHARDSFARWQWITVGAATTLAIGVGMVYWLPVYSEQFSVEAVVNDARSSATETPIVCYGHGWDSIGFYLERDDVRTFLGPGREAIATELAKHPRTIVFISTRRDGGDFSDRLPDGMRYVPLASSRQANVGIVERIENRRMASSTPD